MKSRNKNLMRVTYLIVVVMVVAMLLSFDKVSKFVGETVKVSGDKINDVAKMTFGIALGAFVITSGVTALAVPIVGLALIAIGLVVIGFFAFPLLNKGE